MAILLPPANNIAPFIRSLVKLIVTREMRSGGFRTCASAASDRLFGCRSGASGVGPGYGDAVPQREHGQACLHVRPGGCPANIQRETTPDGVDDFGHRDAVDVLATFAHVTLAAAERVFDPGPQLCSVHRPSFRAVKDNAPTSTFLLLLLGALVGQSVFAPAASMLLR
jgi:hypothetical protein